MSLQIIQEILRDGYDYFVVPKTVLDVPIQMSEMAKEDENGNPTDAYYSLNELHKALGSQFTFVPVIDDRFVAFRWAVDWDDTQSVIIDYLTSNGLTDMRDNGTGGRLKVTDIDFSSLKDTDVGMFNLLAFKKVPKVMEKSI